MMATLSSIAPNYLKLLSTVKFKNNLFLTFFISCIIAGVSQSAPVSGRRERWNPYHYPSVRSLSMPPPPSPSPLQKVTSTSTSYRPRIIRSTTLRIAERRTSHSQNSTNHKANANMKDDGKVQFKFDVGNVTAISLALNEFIRSAEVLVRELLISTNTGMLKVIGQVDQGFERFQKRLTSSGIRLAFAGQRAASKTYEAFPPFVNKLIQKLVTPAEGRSREQLQSQLNDAVNNLRELKKMLADALDEHEKDFHNVFQDRFTQVNEYLRVPGLPRKPLAWYP